MMHEREVRPRRSSCEAGEQGRAICCGVGGAKGGDRGECEPAQHGPGSVPAKRVTGAGAHTASSPSTPEVGAVCGKAARTVLCGGRSEMSVPTAIAALAMTALHRTVFGCLKIQTVAIEYERATPPAVVARESGRSSIPRHQ